MARIGFALNAILNISSLRQNDFSSNEINAQRQRLGAGRSNLGKLPAQAHNKFFLLMAEPGRKGLRQTALLPAVFYFECFSNQLAICSNLILPDAIVTTNSYLSCWVA